MGAALIDPHNRRIEYLRLSVTDRCDLRCSYCLPKGFSEFEEPAHWLSFDEILRLVGAFVRLGVRRVRLTGGEPLTRRDLPTLAARLRVLPGLEDLSLSTNAVRLAKLAPALAAAGVDRVNVSLDSLRPERFAEITGGGKLEKVLAGLSAAKASGLQPVKINMVAMRGVNDDEFEDMVDFCLAQGFTLRLIETMPLGATGRSAVADHYLDLQDVRRRLAERFDLIDAVMPGAGPRHPSGGFSPENLDMSVYGGGPARYARVRGTDLMIGFITPLSQHFCETCNRVRLAADGTLHLCLGQNDQYAFGPLLRAGASDEALERAIREALALKPARHEFRDQPEKVIRFMAATGG